MTNKYIKETIINLIQKDGRFVVQVPKKRTDKFVWLLPQDGYCDSENCHYELNWCENHTGGHDGFHIFAEIHFENKYESEQSKYKEIFNDIPNIESFIWLQKKFGYRLRDNCKVALDTSSKNTIFNCVKESVNNIYKLFDSTYYRLKLIEMDYTKLLEENYNIILHGAPGTGKTYLAYQIAEQLIVARQNQGQNGQLSEDEKKEQIDFVQFHPSYDYTDFVEGLRPINTKGSEESDLDSSFCLKRQNGIFKDFCEKANKNQDKTFVFIIDEINRGEISKIFGELFFSIDPGYRYHFDAKDNKKVKTQYQNLVKSSDVFYDGFFVPDNVYIIGTMNDIDRSVDSMDFAFRRRFTFVEISAKESQSMLNDDKAWRDKNGKSQKPNSTALQEIKNVMNSLNKKIWHKSYEDEKEADKSIDGLSSSYHIGAAYFLKIAKYKIDENSYDFEKLWKYHLAGLFREYLRGIDDADDKYEQLKNAYDSALKDNQNDTSNSNGQ